MSTAVASRTFTLIIPVYCNEGSLPELFRQILEVEQQLLAQKVALQLIFVDDGSRDASYEKLKKIKADRPQTVVVKLTRNFGATAACKAGLAFATGDACALGSADLQDPLYLVPQMVDHWLAGAKFVACVREGRDDPPATRVFASFANWTIRRFVMPTYPKGGFDIALLDRVLWEKLRDAGKSVNSSLMSYWLGWSPVVIPYRREKRLHGRSMWSFSKKLVYFIDSLVVFSILPLRLLSAIGITVAFAAIVYGGVIVTSAVFGERDVPGFATIVTLLAFFSGIQLAILAAIGEYIWRIFDEINRRPEAVVESVL